MYGKIFESIYKGTLYGQWEALITFQQMIVLCDSDGVIDMTPPAISAITSIPLNIIEKGIEVLENPDPYSRTPDHEGRRIERLDDHRPWGWRIVNHEKYRDMTDYDTIKEQNRERQRRRREKLKEVGESNVTSRDSHAPSRHTDTDTNTDTNTKKSLGGSDAPPKNSYTPEFETAWKQYPPRSGSNDKRKAFKAWTARIKAGQAIRDMIDGTARYARYCESSGKTGTEFVMQAATFYGPADPPHFRQQWAIPPPTPKTDSDWIAKGQAMGIHARPGESMREFMERVRHAH